MGLKESLKLVNRTRPKAVVVSGYIDEACRMLLGKVNETIPVILNDGCFFYSFWICGTQGLVLRSTDFINSNSQNNEYIKDSDQMSWLREELEQSRMSQNHTFAFVDCNPEKLPGWLLNNLARGNTLCLYGISEGQCYQKSFQHTTFNRTDRKNFSVNESYDDIDETSLLSSDTGSDTSSYIMSIIHRGDCSV